MSSAITHPQEFQTSETPLGNKSTVEEIQARFDQDVDRFSDLKKGPNAAIDIPLILSLAAEVCARHLHPGDTVLDVGCGAGNFILRILQDVDGLHCHLADLSRPMLDRAQERLLHSRPASVTTHQGDLRTLSFPEASLDAILAGAVLHHLRDEADWAAVFARFYRWLKPGGRLYVSDLVHSDVPDVQAVLWKRYGERLVAEGGLDYQQKVFAYIDKEDSPRSIPFQFELLKATGFSSFDVLHRNSVFACYVGVK